MTCNICENYSYLNNYTDSRVILFYKNICDNCISSKLTPSSINDISTSYPPIITCNSRQDTIWCRKI